MATNNKDAFRDYLQLEKKYSPHTINAYLNDIAYFESFNKQYFEQDAIEQVNYNQIRSWIVSLVEDGVSNSTVNRKIASLKAFYRFLLKIKQIQINPLLKHKALKTEKKLQIPFSEKELTEALSQNSHSEGFQEIRDKLIVELFYTSGIRRTELIHLKCSNVNIMSNTLKVLGKRNKERILPILPIVVQQLSLYIKERSFLETIVDGDYLFLTKKGLKLSDSFVYRLINSYFSTVSEKVKKKSSYITTYVCDSLIKQRSRFEFS